MTLDRQQSELQHLHRLYQERERQAQEAVVTQQNEVQRVLDRLQEQQSLIAGLREQIRMLHELRDPSASESLTAESLIMESARRRWLSYDLEQEVFYLSGFESDVFDARSELRTRQRALVRARGRISGIEELQRQNRQQQTRVELRREDAQLDDRPRREYAHG